MLICYQHNFIYLKAPKTAGTSVEMALEPLCVPPGSEIRECREAMRTPYGIVGARGPAPHLRSEPLKRIKRRLGWRSHNSARYIRLRIGKQRWHQSIKIANIRNPFDQLVSAYHFRFHYNTKKSEPDFAVLRKHFLEKVKNNRFRLPYNRKIFFLFGNYIIDKVIRFEHLHDDLAALQNELMLPIDPVANLPHTKKTSRRHPVSAYFDRQAIEIVKSRFAWVFDRFDYPTEPAD